MRSPFFSRSFRALYCTGLLAVALALRLLLPDGQAVPLTQTPVTAPVAVTEATEPETTASVTEVFAPETTPAPVTEPFAPETTPAPDFLPAEADRIALSGNCDYTVDKQALLCAPLPFSVQPGPQVLILHTHTTEAYTPTQDDSYTPTGAYHTLEADKSVLAVGDALATALQAQGVAVLHDTAIHDYPDYNASYANAKTTIERQLAAHPSVVLVIDLHRDALDEPQREAVTLDGADCAKLMFVVGTDQGGLYHPFWQENLSVALKLQALLARSAPGLCRPLNLRRERFNGQASPGAFIVEVGSTGNTLEEALRSMPYLAQAIATLLRIADCAS